VKSFFSVGIFRSHNCRGRSCRKRHRQFPWSPLVAPGRSYPLLRSTDRERRSSRNSFGAQLDFLSKKDGPTSEGGDRNECRNQKNPDWIDWKGCKARQIILEDLEKGILSLEESEVSTMEAWELYIVPYLNSSMSCLASSKHACWIIGRRCRKRAIRRTGR
jgi:hypothetical protein